MDYSRKENSFKSQVQQYTAFLELNSNSVWMKDRCEPEEPSSNCSVVYKDGPSLHVNTTGPVIEIFMIICCINRI